MSYNYTALKTGTVRNLLTKFGFAVTFTRKSLAAYTPGANPVNTTSEITGYGVLDAFQRSEIDGEVVQQGDSRLYFEGESEPVIGDTLTIGSQVWRVEAVQPIQPGGVAVMWELRIRK